MKDQPKSWRVVIVGPTGTVHKDTNAFKLSYPFPTRKEAEEHAKMLLAVGMKIAFTDEQGNLAVCRGEEY
jgi:hypothetical protein